MMLLQENAGNPTDGWQSGQEFVDDGTLVTDGSLLAPPDGGNFSDSVDFLFNFITWVDVVFFVPIIILTVWFALRYRRRKESETPAQTATHNTPLEVTWSILPGFLLVAFFLLGFRGYKDMTTAPEGAHPITVTAQQWAWTFSYPNGAKTKDLYVPAGEPVQLLMGSQDVIHSLYVPAFRVKQDVVPGRMSTVWFTADADVAGQKYRLFCTEYCGLSHSQMNRVVHVVPADEWPPEVKDDPVARGKDIYASQCLACHTTDGSPRVGPTWLDLWGSTREVLTGEMQGGTWTPTGRETVTVDMEYLIESVRRPNESRHPDYQNMVMNALDLTEQELQDVAAYMKTLSKHAEDTGGEGDGGGDGDGGGEGDGGGDGSGGDDGGGDGSGDSGGDG